MSGYVYNLTTSHYAFLGDRNTTIGIADHCPFPDQRFYRSVGEDVSFDCVLYFQRHSACEIPKLQWYVYQDGVEVLVNKSLRYNIDERTNKSEFISQLVILNITEEDFGQYSCFFTNNLVSQFVLNKVDLQFTRLLASPGSIMSVAIIYNSVDNPHFVDPSPHYKINGQTDAVKSDGGCSPALGALSFTSYFDPRLGLFVGVSINTHLVGSAYDEEPGELDRPLYTDLYLRFCLSPEWFGLYTFYTNRTFYNTSSKTFETVTAEHPWTILVEPRLPDGINWFIPGYNFIPVYQTELNNSYKELYQTVLSGEHMFEKGASVVLWVQWCVFLVLIPSLCLVGLYIYSKYAPGVILFLSLYLVKTFSLILRVRTHVSETEPAGALPGYDLMVLSSEDSKYWVNEYIITPVREWYLLPFWEELLCPDSFYLSPSLEALVKSRKVVVIASPESPDDRLFCFKFECLLDRVVEGFLSPVDVMLVRWGNVNVDRFRHHHQFEFFDWDNTVFPRDAFKRKLSKWLGV